MEALPKHVWSFAITAESILCERLRVLLSLLQGSRSVGTLGWPVSIRPKEPAAKTHDLAIVARYRGQCLGGLRQDSPLDFVGATDQERTLPVDHIAFCVTSQERTNYIDHLARLIGQPLVKTHAIHSIESRLQFSSTMLDGVDINVISPLKDIPHLSSYLRQHPTGGILHLGILVDSMEKTVAACRTAQVSLLSDRLQAIQPSLSGKALEAYSQVVELGFAEERVGSGIIRQTFAFPSDRRGDPFLEFVERTNFSGYGNTISATLVEFLDLYHQQNAALEAL